MLFKLRFLAIWRMPFLEKKELVNEFYVNTVSCHGNTLLLGIREHCSAEKELNILLFPLGSASVSLLL